MKIIIDDKIPYIKEAAEKIAEEVIYAPGKDFTRKLVQDADALIIRTRTHCNRELLEGSKVKFIATATIGFDHIDTEYCKKQSGQSRTRFRYACTTERLAKRRERRKHRLHLTRENSRRM